jgi:hypothetical protein
MARLFNCFVVFFVLACTAKNDEVKNLEPEMNSSQSAEVLSVEISGMEMNYSFNVEVKSPDTGCKQYADWWEVVTTDSVLVYRRILTHSHVTEQPFKRSGGPVSIAAKAVVIIRAHMNNLGYGTHILQGSVQTGFSKKEIDTGFAAGLAQQNPLPGDCPN